MAEGIEISDNLFSTIFYTFPAPMSISGFEDGIMLDINHAFETWSGYSRAEIIGCTTLELGIWSNEEERRLFTKKIFEEGKIEFAETNGRTKNRGLRDILLFAKHISLDNRSVILAHIHDITLQRQLEKELREHRDHLEELVGERTSRLTDTIELLGKEVEERKKSEAALRSREIELEEMNSALKVLLKKRDEDRADIEGDILATVKISILPYIEKMSSTPLDENQKGLLGKIESQLEEITSPFVRKLSSEFLGLSPNEIRVASLIKEGKTSKEIASMLNISAFTVMSHRRSIRKKTALRGKNINLSAFLQSLG